MPRQQLITIILVFLTGMFAGAYLYVSGFVPMYIETGVGDGDAARVFTLNAEQFGGCGMSGACPSFQLLADRSYRYLPSTDSATVFTGTLNKKLFDELGVLLLAADFVVLNQAGGTCRAAYDGIDYRYTILHDGETYELTTCNTRFGDTALDRQLQAVWRAIEEASVSEREYRGPAEVLVDRFRPEQ